MKPTRTTPFTPHRAGSNSSTSDRQPRSRSSLLLPRSSAPSSLFPPGSASKIKASVSVDARIRSTATRPRSILTTIPGSPKREAFRPGTPGSPMRGGSRSSSPLPPSISGVPVSEMDVSVIDPEAALVDSESLQPGADPDPDLSGEFDEAVIRKMLCGSDAEEGREASGADKVLVSIRVRPSSAPIAWSISSSPSPSIKLQPQYAKSTASGAAVSSEREFSFDNILTGSANAPIYAAAAQAHVVAAMEGFNAVVFAYGQTASGKTYTLTGGELENGKEEPGIIPRAMKDVFRYIRSTPDREYLLRCSYLEIYNETIHDLLAGPASAATGAPVQILGSGEQVWLAPLREEVVTSLKGVKAVLERGYGCRRTATTDWNERSSRSHSVFRLVIESRERGPSSSSPEDGNGCATPNVPPTPGGSRLQARGGRSVRTSVLSLIDLAGSERATSDKERTREGRYINTSLLTLGTVIGTLAENHARGKTDHVPFRNSKLTRLLQPSLSGNARISVICTLNPDVGAVGESMSTLLFAGRVKKVHLNAQKKEIINTDALIERYKREIEDLKRRLAEKEAEGAADRDGATSNGGGRKRRLSAREQLDETRAMGDLNSRIKQLTKLILTSQTVDESSVRGEGEGEDGSGGEERPESPTKVDFDLSPYQLRQELFAARRQLESQATQILSLEAALLDRPALPTDAPEGEKDRVIMEQGKTIRELEVVVGGYEDNLGAPLRQVREDVEREWEVKVEEERRGREEKEAWCEELCRELEKEKAARKKLEEERAALQAFVKRFDALSLSLASPVKPPKPLPGGAPAVFAERRQAREGFSPKPNRHFDSTSTLGLSGTSSSVPFPAESPVKMDLSGARSILLEQLPEEGSGMLSLGASPVKLETWREGDEKENMMPSAY